MASRTRKTPAAATGPVDWAAVAKLAKAIQMHVHGQPGGYGKGAGTAQEVQLYFDSAREPGKTWRVSYVAGVAGTRRSWKVTYGADPMAALQAARDQQTGQAEPADPQAAAAPKAATEVTTPDPETPDAAAPSPEVTDPEVETPDAGLGEESQDPDTDPAAEVAGDPEPVSA